MIDHLSSWYSPFKTLYWFECDCQNTETASPLVFLWLWKQHRLPTDRALTRCSELIAMSIFLECQSGFSTLVKERCQQTILLPVAGLSRHKQQGSLWTREVTTGFPVRLPLWWLSFKQQYNRQNIFKLPTVKLQKNCQELSEALYVISAAGFTLFLLSKAKKYELVFHSSVCSAGRVGTKLVSFIYFPQLNFARVYPSELRKNNPD